MLKTFKDISYRHFLLPVVILIVLGVSCKKDSPFHNYESTPTVVYEGNVIQYLESQKGLYDSMAMVLKRFPDLVAKLNSNDSVTLFAIPNSAFELAVRNFNFYRQRVDSPKLYFAPNPLNMNRADSGMFHYQTLRELISRYVFDGTWDYERVKKSLNGIPVNSFDGYQMNIKAMQESTVGVEGEGPKVLELSDMNYSVFRLYWKSITTSSISAVRAKNVLVHALSTDHEFGFASFIERLSNPTIDRRGWTPLEWHSQFLGQWGGTVRHAFDNNLYTNWYTLQSNMPPPPYFFTIDMKRTVSTSGFTLQARIDGNNTGIPVEGMLEFARDGVDLADSANWVRHYYNWSAKADAQTVKFPQTFWFGSTVTARYFRFSVTQNFSRTLLTTNKFTNLNEIWLQY